VAERWRQPEQDLAEFAEQRLGVLSGAEQEHSQVIAAHPQLAGDYRSRELVDVDGL
jgi:hypothetical protein